MSTSERRFALGCPQARIDSYAPSHPLVRRLVLEYARIMKYPQHPQQAAPVEVVAVAPVLNAGSSEDMRSVEPEEALRNKDVLSAYMAIAASAFGLISDGCEFAPVYHTCVA